MSTYCVSKAKLLIQCENIDLFRKGDFLDSHPQICQRLQLKGLLDVCQQSIQGRGFDAQKPLRRFVPMPFILLIYVTFPLYNKFCFCWQSHYQPTCH